MSADSFINAHRPTRFSEIIGQDDVVKSYKAALDDKTSHAFLFTGAAGLGKTTLARCGAAYVGINERNIMEVDAATFNSVDDMRPITQAIAYRPLGKDAKKAYILDECHFVSRQGWASLLKSVEEPPDWVYWFFCTTDVQKVPDAIKTRCASYVLRPVTPTVLFDHLNAVVQEEGFDTPRSILELCCRQADGSPRKALANLAVCYAAENREAAARLIANLEEEEGGTSYALAKALVAGSGWDKVRPILETMTENPESVRHVVQAYITKVIVGLKDEKKACIAFKILDAFSEPFNPADGMSPLVVAIGRSLF